MREPWRIAAAVLARAGMTSRLFTLPFAERVPTRSLATIAHIAVGHPFARASGVGRLFEAAGALLGTCVRNGYEGEAAARLEVLASRASSAGAWDPWPEVRLEPDRPELPSTELFVALVHRLVAHEAPADVAAGFHATFAARAADLAVRCFPRDVRTLALGGGCLVNRHLRRLLARALGRAGYDVLLPRELPPGDGGIAYGQAVLAAHALARGVWPHSFGDLPCA